MEIWKVHCLLLKDSEIQEHFYVCSQVTAFGMRQKLLVSNGLNLVPLSIQLELPPFYVKEISQRL